MPAGYFWAEKVFMKRIIIISLLACITAGGYAASPQVKADTSKRPFLIGIFWGPPAALSTNAQYQAIKAAHVDYIQFTEDALHPGVDARKRNREILELAGRNGLAYYPADPLVNGSEADIARMVNTYKNNPATGGYYIKDEPGPGALNKYAAIYRQVVRLDPARVPFVNLLPDFAVKDYEKGYVEKWVEKVGKEHLQYLSFDNYPFRWDGSFGETYFNNLDIFRRAGLKYDVKTSCYLQSMGITGAYRRPGANELRYSVYSALAYGIKNMVWFTYCTPTGQPVEKFMSAVVDSNGNKTDLYEPFKEVNGEAHQLGKTLIGLDAVEVYHTQPQGPGQAALPAGFFFQPEQRNADLIITHFVSRVDKKTFVMVVNKSLTSRQQLVFDIHRPVKKIYEVSKTGRKHSSAGYTRKSSRFQADFLPGEGKLFELK